VQGATVVVVGHASPVQGAAVVVVVLGTVVVVVGHPCVVQGGVIVVVVVVGWQPLWAGLVFPMPLLPSHS
jgi:hypothetical protein